MAKNNYIIESMYAKYAGVTDIQKKRRNLKEGYEEEGPQTDDTIEEYSAGAMKSDWGQAGLIISKRLDGWYYLILGEKPVGPFRSMQEAISQCRKDNPDKELVNFPRYANETKLHIYKTYPAPLDEARNPENDEVNTVIRKWANSDRNRLSKKDQKTLDKYGISLKDEDSALKQHVPKEMKKYYSGKRMVGSNPQIQIGLTKNAVKSKHDDFDSANYLNKKRKTNLETHRENILKNAENHAKKRKNESLSLNEGAQHTKFMMKILQAVQEHLDNRYENINITIDSQASGLVVSDGAHTENYNITLKMAPVYSISNGVAGTIYKFTPVSVTTVSDYEQVATDLIGIIKQDFDL